MDDIQKLNWSWHTIRQSKEYSKYFNATFSDNKDIFFKHLNEMQDFSQSESDDESCNTGDEGPPIDPRNQNQITKIVLDYSSSAVSKSGRKSGVFDHFTRASTLTKEEHEAGLKALRTSTEPNELIAAKKDREMKEFNDFLANWLATQPNKNYKLLHFILTQYMEIFKQETEALQHHPDQFYLIQTAIPFGENSDSVTQYSVGDLLQQIGHVPELHPSFQYDNILKSQPIERNEMRLLDSIHLKNVEQFSDVDVIVPERTLHLLLSPSTCLDMWEIKFNVVASDNRMNNQILFEEPLPLRCHNRSVCTAMFEKMVNCCMQRKGRGSKLSLNDGKITTNCNNEIIIHAVDLNREYQLEGYDEFLSKLPPMKKHNSSDNTNTILREWTMTKKDGDVNANVLKMLTESMIPYFMKEEGAPTYINLSLKLEYKTEFGAEAMTKDELILEWLRQFLIGSGYTIRVRLDADTAEHILTQRLDLKDIEVELFRLYRMKPENMLSSLYSILSMVQNFPVGQYLLKFNPKFNDKLMIYLKTEERSPNGLSLRELYGHFQMKIDNLQTFEYIPVDGNVVTPLHSTSHILPCCFPYWLTSGSTAKKNKPKMIDLNTIRPGLMKTRKVWKQPIKKCTLAKMRKDSIVSSGSDQMYNLRSRISDVTSANRKGNKLKQTTKSKHKNNKQKS